MGWTRRIPVVLNPAPARVLPPDLLTRVTVLTPNETEALQLLATHESLEMDLLAARLLDLGVDIAVMTVGPAGAVIATPDGVEMVAGIPVRAVDTVAAGDCFTGALAVEFASGRSLRDAVSFANAAAAVKVTRPGAQPGLPKREDVADLIATRSRHTA
jgi:ribokinase